MALWYGALTAVVVLAISLATYATHTRAHYDDLDQLLVGSSRHIASEGVAADAPDQLTTILLEPAASGVVTRVYEPGGRILATSPASAGVPSIDPGSALRNRSVSAFDPVAGLAPAFVRVDPSPGVFAVVSNAAGERWRIYVLPLSPNGRYLEATASLVAIDASVERLRLLLLGLGVAGTLGAFLAAWLLAARALEPVRTVTASAGAIASSRDFANRVPESAGSDELGDLQRTFNRMLESLEVAYRSQQRFVADASHEMRAPLTAIQANLELLESQPLMSEADRKAAVEEASQEAQRLSRLVVDLLALARADAGVAIRRTRVELDRVVVDTVRESGRTADSRQIEIGDLAKSQILGDEDRIKQLLLIVLDNAVKYSPAGTEIRVNLRLGAGHVELRVKDSGAGIAEDDLPHIFERFYRADPARSRDPGGTGLGLPIARWIVEQHGGQIDVKSSAGRGTEVIVTLPVEPLT